MKKTDDIIPTERNEKVTDSSLLQEEKDVG